MLRLLGASGKLPKLFVAAQQDVRASQARPHAYAPLHTSACSSSYTIGPDGASLYGACLGGATAYLLGEKKLATYTMNLAKTYWRVICTLPTPYRTITLYIATTSLVTLFNMLSWGLLFPLLQMLFQELPITQVSLGSLSFSASYVKQLFYCCFIYVLKTYGKLYALYFLCGVLLTARLLSSTFEYLGKRIMGYITSQIGYRLRQKIWAKIMDLPAHFFTKRKKGALLARCINEVQITGNGSMCALRALIKVPMVLISFFIALMHVSVHLTLWASVFLALGYAVLHGMLAKLFDFANQAQVSTGRLTYLVNELLTHAEQHPADPSTPQLLAQLEQENARMARIRHKIVVNKGFIPVLTDLLWTGIIVFLLAYGGYQSLRGVGLPTSTFLSYIIIFARVLGPINLLSKTLSNAQRSVAAAQHIFNLLDKEVTPQQGGIKQV